MNATTIFYQVVVNLFHSRLEKNIMAERFRISTVVENGHPHYKILDCKSGKEFHCDFGELNNILYELMGE